MTVSSTEIKKTYNCNGSLQVFPFNFPLASLDDLKVVVDDYNGKSTPLKPVTDYSIVAVNNSPSYGGSITTVQIYPAKSTITLYRDTTETQDLSLKYRTTMPAGAIEDALDKSIMIAQELADKIANSIKYPITESGGIVELPPKKVRSLNFFSFDEQGNPTTPIPVAWVEATNTRIGNAEVKEAQDVAHLQDEVNGIQNIYNFWKPNTAITAKQWFYTKQNGQMRLICTKSGITSDTEPIWGQIGSTQIDNTVTWLISDMFTVVPPKSVGEDTLTDQLDAHMNSLNKFQQTGSTITRTLQQKATESVSVLDFGAVGDGKADDTQAIQNALSKLKNNGGILIFPKGVYLTDYIDLTTYKGITLQGDNTANTWLSITDPAINYSGATVIKIRSACEVGIQIVKPNQVVPDIGTFGMSIDINNITLDCNLLANNGINMNQGIRLSNVVVKNAVVDGIVLEGMTYPVTLNNVYSTRNGRHGLYVKPCYTTIYNISNCEFSINGGYGIVLESGAGCHLSNIVIQSNKTGGIKLNAIDPATLPKPTWFSSLLLNSIYAEDNGLLETNDPKYEGNYAFYVTSYNTNPTTLTGKIACMSLACCSFNESKKGSACKIEGTGFMSSDNGEWFSLTNYDRSKNYNQGDYQYFSSGLRLLSPSRIRFESSIPSSDPNTLDCYQEGSFVPTLTVSGKTVPLDPSSSANYTRIGNVATVNIKVKVGTITTPFEKAHAVVGTLPFKLLSDTTYLLTLGQNLTKIQSGFLVTYGPALSSSVTVKDIVDPIGDQLQTGTIITICGTLLSKSNLEEHDNNY